MADDTEQRIETLERQVNSLQREVSFLLRVECDRTLREGMPYHPEPPPPPNWQLVRWKREEEA